MKCSIDGHEYYLNHLDNNGLEKLNFVNRGHGVDKPGTNNQEVLRVLIDRVKYLDNELRWEGNDKILYHLRMALALHETRHIERLVEKEKMKPEEILVGYDGHFIIG